jgi:hypothetical protein
MQCQDWSILEHLVQSSYSKVLWLKCMVPSRFFYVSVVFYVYPHRVFFVLIICLFFVFCVFCCCFLWGFFLCFIFCCFLFGLFFFHLFNSFSLKSCFYCCYLECTFNKHISGVKSSVCVSENI